MPLGHAIITAALRAIGAYSGMRRPHGRVALGRALGHAMMRIDKRRQSITRHNVQQSFPGYSETDVEHIVVGSYENLGITLAELLAVPTMSEKDILSLMEIHGCEEPAERLAARQPTVMVAAHFGNWELLAMAVGIAMRHPLTMVVHPQKNVSADQILNTYRRKYGNILVPFRDAARTLMRTLEDGGAAAFLADQHADPTKDAWIDFFGRPTPTYEAPAALALRFGSPIYTAFPVRQPDGHYVARIEAIRSDDLPNDRDGIRALTERHVRALEDAVRAHPTLWSWQHRRWRQVPS
jgi:KDO2-lipid IV(A) lauroyltransferase